MKLSAYKFCIHNKSHLQKIFDYTKIPSYEKKFIIKGKYGRSFYQCKLCKHIYSSHAFSINNLYSQQYLELTYKNLNGIKKRFKQVTSLSVNKSDNKNRSVRVDSFFKKKNLQLLDVGSGIGVFLHEMKKKNWNVTGIEMDKRYVDFCKKFKKLNVHKTKLERFKKRKNFDLITFNKVLEHVVNPIKLFKLSKFFLNEGGIVYIEVPDIRAKTHGKQRQEFCVDHLHIFSPKSLKYLATVCGFETLQIKRIHEPSGKFTLYGFFKKKNI